VQFHPDRLAQPLRWKKPRRIFVCSMGDLFHEDLPLFDETEKVFEIISACYKHTFMVLTKRPRRMRAAVEHCLWDGLPYLLNLWLGVTAENQEMADQRIPILLQTPAAVRFVSVEPMLGPVDLKPFFEWTDMDGERVKRVPHWVICGGETGPGARFMRPEWVKSLRDQCKSAGVPFFFKGWGTSKIKKSTPNYMKIDGKEHKGFPEVNGD
jgi:protein gp37